MPTFQYQALDEKGKKKKGFLEAESRAKAFSLLQDKGLLPLGLTSVSKSGGGIRIPQKIKGMLPGPKVRLGEAFYYLGVLLQTGTALAEALDLIGRMAGKKSGRIWLNIRDSVETGKSFSQAMSEYPKVFPKIYIGMVRVAENVGRLGQVLERVSQYEEQRSEVSNRLLTAMAYPSIILLVGMGAVYFLLSQVLPNIADIFKTSDKALPVTTQLLLGLGKTLEGLGLISFLIPLLGVLGLIYAYRYVERFRTRVDELLWKIPLVRKNALARFSGMLGFQLEAGIPLVQAMEGSAEAVGSTFFRKIIEKAKDEVSAGQPLDKVLEKTGAFPDIYILTLATGQRAGKLGLFLLRLTRILEKELDNMIKRMTALAEPLLILGVGLIIGLIVTAVMGPIFDLTTLVR